MEQFEQLLTCCVCLDRYRNPKLLPCQHSFCMEPCMEGLVDYVRRQVKCPECRAEHRIPYQGVQAFPTNVTLQRFLELHIEITGELPDPTSGQVMERCNVCSEKAYCAACAHCEKKICEDCKSAHMDILRREILRINSQVRRGINRLQDALAIVEKNTLSLQSNCVSVSEEVDEIYRRLNKALKDRSDHLRTEIDRYLGTELRNLTNLRENLDLEIGNIQSNCDLADKYITESVEWDDNELMDTKEIFLKTVEFLRNFEYENADYSRRVRFLMAMDPNQLVINVSTFGDLNIVQPTTSSPSGMLQPPNAGPGLMRSKSDHRLATQFRQQEEQRGHGYDDEPPLSGRKFGERHAGRNADRYGGDRYGRDYGGDYEYDEPSSRPGKSRFRSRFVRSHQGDNDSDTEPSRSVRFHEKEKEKERDRVIDTEDVARGQLSGIIRLTDSPRVMKRIQEQSREKKEPTVQVAPALLAQQKTAAVAKKTPAPAGRQVSEDDDISRIKRQNKGAPSGAAAAEPERPAAERVTALKRTTAGTASDDSDSSRNSTARKTPPQVESTNSGAPKAPTPAPKKTTRSASSDSSTSTDSSSSATGPRNTGAAFTTEEVKQKYLQRSSIDATADATPPRTRPSETTSSPATTTTATGEKKPFQSRFLPNHQSPKPKEESESSTEEETSTEESEEEEEEEEEEVKPAVTTAAPTSVVRTPPRDTAMKTDIGPLLARSSQARETGESRRTAREEPKSYTGSTNSYRNYERDTSPKYGAAGSSGVRSRASAAHAEPEEHSRYGSGASSGSRYGASSSLASQSSDLSRSRSSHALKSRENSPDRSTGGDKDGAALSSWARYLKNKYGNRSTAKDARDPGPSSTSSVASSSASRRLSLGLPLRQANELASSDDDSKNGLGSPTSPTVAAVGITGAAGILDRFPRTQYLQKRRQLFQLGGRGSEPGSFTWPRGIAVSPDNNIVVADSSNHRVQIFDANGIFMKEFGEYGNAEGEFDCLAGVAVNRIGQYIIADRYNHRIQVLDPAGRFLRAFGSQGTTDGKFNYPWGVTTDALGFIYVCDKENHRVQVFQSDGTFVGKFGTCGSKEGQLEHPHYIAVSSTNRVIVSDSNNHRIQIFDVNGRVLSTFGSEGCEDGQFKFPRGVAVDDQGYICVADSGNNRIQIFTPEGSFLRAFGSWGSADSEFKGLEGVAIMSNGNILVCDRENHRVQVF
ncbi:RING finger protein nhl-1 isoform X2 [Phlebotomus argentipes]|uniref:RING finger protein nhl-1 isoform X2 n=1 Tax=Phlebotomus argentipes TaxID=94469 RepID=UPI00289346FF|nr:RING finger protein nhl-1 isoform X2 [Phlebotomus argentipes]